MKPFASNTRDREIGDDKVLYIPLSILLPAIIIVITMMILQIFPFGEHNLLISDAYYAPNTLSFFNRLLHGQVNALYSFENGLGYNNWAVLSWAGISPVSLLAWFATLETMPSVFTWIVVLNLSLCGLTMYIFLAYVRGHRLDNLIFSTSYALMGFNVAYCFHIGFFVGPQFLPLVVLGIIKITQGKSPLLYILSLACSIFCNFYFGFMLCVASVAVICGYLYAEESAPRGKRLKAAGRWLVSSLIAGMLAAPMWLSAIKAFSSGGGRIDQARKFGMSFYENMPFIQIFSKLFSGAISEAQERDGLPFIFCGILVVALVILYFMNREIPKRRKKAAGAVLGFYLLTFYISAFTKLMHGGTHTNWFPYRYSFVFSFFLICIAAEEFKYVFELSERDAKRCGVALIVSTILVLSTNYEFIIGGAVVMDLALLVVMWLIVRLHQKKPMKVTQKGVTGLLLLAASVNLFANFALSIHILQDWQMDMTLYKANVMFSGSSVDALKQYDKDFFRMEKDVSDSGSLGIDSYLYGFNSVSCSGPAYRMQLHSQLSRIGLNWYDMRHWYQTGVPAATDALLGVKYIIASRTDVGEEKDYPRIVATEENAIYQNPNALGVAILANGETADLELGSNAFENLNAIWSAMTGGGKDIFTLQEDVDFTLHNATETTTVASREIQTSISFLSQEVEGETLENSYVETEFVAEHTGPVYRNDFSVPDSEYGIQGVTVKYCGYFQEGDTVKDIISTNSTSVPQSMFLEYCSHIAYAYGDNDILADYAEELNARDITFNVEHENDLTGSFTAGPGQRILFTVPWDEGWTCYIDGQQVPIHKTWDLFMSVEAPEGEHTYEMRFFPAWMNYGLYLSGAALTGLVIFMVVWSMRRKKNGVAT